MKFHVWFFCMLFSFISSACAQDEEITDLSNPSLLRSSYIDDSSLHLAFPTIVGNSDRSKILIVYRAGTDHLSYDGKLVQVESYDKGKTWVNKKVIYTPKRAHDVRDPQFIPLPGGPILCRFFERKPDSTCVVKSFLSDNMGKSYDSPVTFPYPTGIETAAARGNMVVVDSVIYSISYNRWAVTWLSKSEDMGKSWQVVSLLDERLWTGRLEQGRINEASLGYSKGKLYVVGRQQADNGDKRLELGISEDLGKTWNWSFLPVEGHAPSLTPYKDAFILTYRNVKDNSSGKYSFDTVLLKDGALASTPVSLFESENFDVGYGDVLTLSNSFLVCCYQPGAIRCFELKYDVFNH